MNGRRDPLGTWAPWHHRFNIGWIISLLALGLVFLAVTQGMGGEWQ